MAGTALERSTEVIEGECEVVLPPPPVRWSFWEDDFPNLVTMIAGPPIAGLCVYAAMRVLGLT